MKKLLVFLSLVMAFSAQAKTFQNSYVSFEVPDDWTCLQEGVAWTCTPTGVVESKEAVIVLVAKVAGPEDNLAYFQNHLKQPKRITTKVGTPMPSQVMYARERILAGNTWVQAQHLGSEVQEYYTLYLATVKQQLAILVSFSAERNRYQVYNPIFDRAIKSLRIVASQQLLFPKTQAGTGEIIGIQAQGSFDDAMGVPVAPRKSSRLLVFIMLGFLLAILAYWFLIHKKPNSFKRKR